MNDAERVKRIADYEAAMTELESLSWSNGLCVYCGETKCGAHYDDCEIKIIRSAVADLLEQAGRMREALEFYANDRNYVQLRGHESPGAETVPRDCGRKAREALGITQVKPPQEG